MCACVCFVNCKMVDVELVTVSKDSFFVHLLSNAQPELFKNKANHFKCQLKTPLQFPTGEEWEVGLKEYHYVNNVSTITQDLHIEVGQLSPAVREEQYKVHRYPYYFTETGTYVHTFYPLRYPQKECDGIVKDSKVLDIFNNFLLEHHLISMLRVHLDSPDDTVGVKLALRNTPKSVLELYPEAKYSLLMSYPMALLLHATSQMCSNANELVKNKLNYWTCDSTTRLGSKSHFDVFTMMQDTATRRKLTSSSGQGKSFTDRLYTPLYGAYGSLKLADTDWYYINRIQDELDARQCVSPDAYSFSFLPMHRLVKKDIVLPSEKMTFFGLFQQIEQLGFGSLHVDADQSYLEFKVRDLSEDGRLCIGLPWDFFKGVARFDKWEWVNDVKSGKTYLRRVSNSFQVDAFTVSFDYDGPMGLTTFKMEQLLKELSKTTASKTSATDARTMVDNFKTEYVKIEYYKKKYNETMMGKSQDKSYFYLTSKMIIRLHVNPKHRQAIDASMLAKAEVASDTYYAPYNFTIYDLKLPNETYSDRGPNLIFRDPLAFGDRWKEICLHVYYKHMQPGLYNIRKERDFSNIYIKQLDLKIQHGFYTPKTLVSHLQHQLKQQENNSSFTLINSAMDDMNQGFMQVKTDRYSYLQFDKSSQELFGLALPFLTPDSTHVTKVPFQLIPDSYNIIIYCNIVEETLVGGNREKILSVTPITHSNYDYGRWVGKEFSDTDYYPLAVKTLHLVEIELRGDTGEFIPITQGRSYVKLHFRKKAK